MARAILGRKLGMTQVWGDDDRLDPGDRHRGRALRRVAAQDGEAGRLRGRPARVRRRSSRARSNKPMTGHFAKAKVEPKRHLAEVRARARASRYKVGQKITVDIFEPGAHGPRHRHEQGQGLPGRHEAPQLQGRSRRPRFALPPRARFDRPVRHPVARVQGPRPSRATWATRRSRSATSRSCASTPSRTCCSSRAPCPAARTPCS